jgi:hypothetical protein
LIQGRLTSFTAACSEVLPRRQSFSGQKRASVGLLTVQTLPRAAVKIYHQEVNITGRVEQPSTIIRRLQQARVIPRSGFASKPRVSLALHKGAMSITPPVELAKVKTSFLH